MKRHDIRRTYMRLAIALLPFALLAACGAKPDASGPSADDDRQLNDAAAALDANDSTAPTQPAAGSPVTAADQPAIQGNAQ
jgi:hypothetical protein